MYIAVYGQPPTSLEINGISWPATNSLFVLILALRKLMHWLNDGETREVNTVSCQQLMQAYVESLQVRCNHNTVHAIFLLTTECSVLICSYTPLLAERCNLHCNVWLLSRYVVCRLWPECIVTKQLQIGSRGIQCKAAEFQLLPW